MNADDGDDIPSSSSTALNPDVYEDSGTAHDDGKPRGVHAEPPSQDHSASSQSGAAAGGNPPFSSPDTSPESSQDEVDVTQSIKPESQTESVPSLPDLNGAAEGGMASGDGIWSDYDSEMKRVKVYELVGSAWVDQGTAFCFGHFTDSNVALLTARSEKNFEEVILVTTIRATDVYQRQQDTLIVWTEPDGVDYALSFQDPDGCAEVWNFILEVQKHMNGGTGTDDQRSSNIDSSSPLVGHESSSSVSHNMIRRLPAPQLGIIGDIERTIKGMTRTPALKERICEYIQQVDYIKQLIDILNMAEDIEALDSLHALCNLMQTILMLNDHTMYEHILDDELFFGVIGMLEYDPEFPSHKANYREFLRQNSHFHQPIPIRDITMQRKIHHTYRLQFLKDVVLARTLDDSTFNVLNSCIIFNQIDIINHVQSDIPFLREIVRLYVDEDMLSGGGNRKPQPASTNEPPKESSSTNGTSHTTTDISEEPSEDQVNLRNQVILLIQQLCAMGKNVQLPARIALFRSLVDRGILFAVQWALGRPEKDAKSRSIISAGGEILSALLDHDLNGVRGHVLKQVVAIEKEREAGKKGSDKAETLLHMVCKIMGQSNDLAVQSQVGDALKSWMDLPPVADAPGGESSNVLGNVSKFNPRKDDPGTERFMDCFYKECVHVLFKPILELPEWKQIEGPIYPLTRERTNRFVYLCDLLYNFCLQHNFRSHFFIASSSICARIPILFKAREKHLRHASFRIFRLLLRQNNPNIHTQIMKFDVLKPILDLTIQESRRDNLLSCSCQEYFDFMRRENMKDLIRYCMMNHAEDIKTLTESPLGRERFTQFIKRWEMNNEPPPPDPPATLPSDRTIDIASWQNRFEDEYFNGEDDDDFIPSISHSQQIARGLVSPPIPNNSNTLKRKRHLMMSSAAKGFRTQSSIRSPILEQLSDYGDDDNDENRPSLSPTVSLSEPPPRLASLAEDDDNVLESLAQRSRSRPDTPTPHAMPNMRIREKRRRDEDDDDDDLARLTKSKKPDLGTTKDGGLDDKPKTGDDPPKKFKLKIESRNIALGTKPSESGPKDGDGG